MSPSWRARQAHAATTSDIIVSDKLHLSVTLAPPTHPALNHSHALVARNPCSDTLQGGVKPI